MLHSVSAYALKAEEMIKLPIYLRYREPWDALLGDAIGLLKHLGGEAAQEEAATGEHIRPIMLLQAQPEYKDKASITVEVVEAKLKEFGIHESDCVHTGNRRGLDGINVLTRESNVRFIITVQALKEGWDCPWAYVLFSVTEMGASRAVEQILGRVLRMPKAKRKQRDDLNNAYAFVASTKFDEAAEALKDGLIASGFEGQDAEDLIVDRGELPGMQPEPAKLSESPVTTTLPDKTKAARAPKPKQDAEHSAEGSRHSATPGMPGASRSSRPPARTRGRRDRRTSSWRIVWHSGTDRASRPVR